MLERGLELLVFAGLPLPHGDGRLRVLCEMVGKCIQHVALGRYSSALPVGRRIGRPILDGIKNSAQRSWAPWSVWSPPAFRPSISAAYKA